VIKDEYGETVPFAVWDIDVEPDGGLLALVTGEPGVLRLGPDGWAPVPIPRQASDVEALAALPDGGILVLADASAWSVTRDGRVAGRRALPKGLNVGTNSRSPSPHLPMAASSRAVLAGTLTP
jgi:hypothetical protein